MKTFVLTLLVIVALGSPAIADAAPPGIDVMLTLDNSGSMRTNDPKRLLQEVATTFAGKLGAQDRPGVVSFDQSPHVLLPLSPVNESGFAQGLTAALKKITYNGRLTDIPGGLEEARHEIEIHGRPQAQRVVVLITDGDIDLGSEARDSDRKTWLRETILPAARAEHVRIFGITLTADADVELIQSMAEETRGDYYRLLTADQIPSVFDAILGRLQQLRTEPPNEKQVPSGPAQAQQNSIAPVVIWAIAAGGGGAVLLLLAVIVLRRRDHRSEPVPKARLIDVGGQTSRPEHAVKRITRIGLAQKQNEIVVPGKGVSRQHARIEYKDGAFRLHDLRSTNGTFLSDERLSPDDATGRMLKHGDIIRLGPYSFQFLMDDLTQRPGDAKDLRNYDDDNFTQRLPVGAALHSGNQVAAAGAAASRHMDETGRTYRKPTADAGEKCSIHQSRPAVATCSVCNEPVCDLDDLVDAPGGGKACRRGLESRDCANLRPTIGGSST